MTVILCTIESRRVAIPVFGRSYVGSFGADRLCACDCGVFYYCYCDSASAAANKDFL